MAGRSGVAVRSHQAQCYVPMCLSMVVYHPMLVSVADSLSFFMKNTFADDPSFPKACLYSCRTPNREMLSWLSVANISNYFLSTYYSSQD